MTSDADEVFRFARWCIRALRWVVLVVLAVVAGFAIVIALAVRDAKGATSAEVCRVDEARYTHVLYAEDYGSNTGVMLVAVCPGRSSVWYVSFFEGLASEGAQPDLWAWYEIQNTASELLRDNWGN